MNIYEFVGDICIIKVKNKVHGWFEFIIDAEDYPRVRMFKWYAGLKKNEGAYCRSSIRTYKKNETLILHRLITSFCFSIVDHINGNTQDNRKSNLRDGSNSVNQINRKKSYKKELPLGVYRSGNKFRARQKQGGKNIEFGTYNTIEEASEAYLKFRNTSSKL